MKDYYKILGVASTASKQEIKKAYRNLAKKYHPDVVKNDKAKQDRMYEIQEAYACLENEQRRKKYDAQCLKNENRQTESKKESFQQKQTDMGQFEKFFGFCPGRGMETYGTKKTKTAQGPIPAEQLFASFFGTGFMQEDKKK